jgi:microcystin-dependent protein
MPYSIKFTDSNNKTDITVYDNVSNFDTSLVFPGRNQTGYGQYIAENFLHLLENFASGASNKPVNPVEGQLWYDSDNKVLNINDGTGSDGWKAASGIQKGPSEPSIDVSKQGELWVDTTNQQLRIFTGGENGRWILVGPSESSVDGLRYGPVVERISDSDNVSRSILVFYIADIPVIIFSKDTFTPKVILTGYPIIKAGININAPTGTEVDNFEGKLLPKLYGVSTAADSLIVSNTVVESSTFLRKDQANTTEKELNVATNTGITIGADRTFQLSTTATSARIYNKQTGSSIDLQTNRDGRATTILRVIDNKIGINTDTPDEALDVDGNIKTTGTIYIGDTSESASLSEASFITLGGASITKNLKVGTTLDVAGDIITSTVRPRTNETYNLGTDPNIGGKRWNEVRAKTVIADTLQGTLNGNISGNAGTATNLKNISTFQLAGDVISPPVQFDGQVGSYTKIFNTSLTANIISGKDEPSPNTSKPDDYILTYRSGTASPSSGLFKQTRDVFVGDMGVPIGTIMPYAGTNVPYGYLLCDGSEVEIAKYPRLNNVIGTIYNGASSLIGVGTFRLPDLRGRFALGRDNMDNGAQVPLANGQYVDGGGGTASRVPDTKAQTLAGAAGSSDVTLTQGNLPDHTHSFQNNNNQYYAVKIDTAINPPATAGLGPTAPGQAQYFNNSGPITKPDPTFVFGQPLGIMNPYLTINYIIRSGPPEFTTTL